MVLWKEMKRSKIKANMPVFDKLKISTPVDNRRFERRILFLEHEKGWDSKNILESVSSAEKNLLNKINRFVIYGEPQSGKTEMMIALTSKILDLGYKIIIVLLKDDLQLLEQNFSRFARSGINPAPRKMDDLIREDILLTGEATAIIFSTKNYRWLSKLYEKVRGLKVVVIDDEGDYATPNAKINRAEKSKINELVEKIVGTGTYLAVTATPARLDLNNTLDNVNKHWVGFKPHTSYVGQNEFFPMDQGGKIPFELYRLPEKGDDPRHLREAVFRFLITVSKLNLDNNCDENFSMLIHTSGLNIDQSKDHKLVNIIINALKDTNSSKHDVYLRRIFELAENKFPDEGYDILGYILKNISRNIIVLMNSKQDAKSRGFHLATKPSQVFTFAIGGNIVSRGVTFENLISMFFTRDVKHRLQQDTYIQRARMFGDRSKYLKYFELTIPEKLYLDWHKCFVLHRLALESINAGSTPVWLEDRRTSVASSSSIDKTSVSFDSGEMSFDIFNYNSSSRDMMLKASESNVNDFNALDSMHLVLGKHALPEYLLAFIKRFSGFDKSKKLIAIHKPGSTENKSDADQIKISRPKGMMGSFDLERERYPDAIHHIKIFYNQFGKARLFYKYTADNLKFIKNFKNA